MAALSTADRRCMFALFRWYYDNTSRARFRADLATKDVVVLVRRTEGEVVGFSTASFHHVDLAGKTIRYLFSGDTIVDAAYWGEATLLKAFFRLAGRRKALHPDERLYWFSIFNGHRTFRVLPNFFRQFVPGERGATYPELERIRCVIARERYGAAFDAATGLIDCGRSTAHLKHEWALLGEAARRSRFAAHFLSQNPEAERGVELAGLAELDLTNLKRQAARMFAAGLRDVEDGFAEDLR